MQASIQGDLKLDFLVGDWKASGVVHPGRFGPGGKSFGNASYRWELGGKWLTYQSRLELPALGDYEVRGGVSFDSNARLYRAFAINSFGFLLVYEGRWANENELVFDLVHPTGTGNSRVVYERLPDGGFKFRSESSEDGLKFEAYFEMTHTRC